MLIALYYILAEDIFPWLGNLATSLLEPFAIILIILVGISMLLGVVGMKMPSNMASTIVGGIIKAIGYVGKQFIQGIGKLIRYICKLIPKLYKKSKDFFIQKCDFGSKTAAFLAVIVCFNVILIII